MLGNLWDIIYLVILLVGSKIAGEKEYTDLIMRTIKLKLL